MKVYRRHNCDRAHRSVRTWLVCAIRPVEWIRGQGDYAVIAWCRVPTITLWPTVEAARQALAVIDAMACGGRCNRRHDLVPRLAPGTERKSVNNNTHHEKRRQMTTTELVEAMTPETQRVLGVLAGALAGGDRVRVSAVEVRVAAGVTTDELAVARAELAEVGLLVAMEGRTDLLVVIDRTAPGGTRQYQGGTRS